MMLPNRDLTLKWHNGLPHFNHKWASGGGIYKVWQIYPHLVCGFESFQVAFITSEAVCLVYKAHWLNGVF